jgi:putative spermidine/putrescine transport system substrate-binding protein
MQLDHAAGRTRREARIIAGFLIAAFVAASWMPAHADETVVMAQFGGVWQSTLEKVLADFQKRKNIKIQFISGSSLASTSKAIASRNNEEIDIVLGEELSHALGEKEQIWDTLDQSIVTNLKDVVPQARLKGDHGVGFIMQSVGMFYMTNIYQKNGWVAPTSWFDLLDRKHCHRIGISHPNVSFAYYALMMLGGGQPSDFPKGAEKLATVKDCIDTMDPSAQKTLQKVQLGEFDLGVMNHPLIDAKAKGGVPVRFVRPKEGAILQLTTAAVTKGAPHAKLAQEVINELLSPAAQGALMAQFAAAPVNRNVALDPKLLEAGAPDPKNLAGYVSIKADEIIEHRDEYIQKAVRVMGQ